MKPVQIIDFEDRESNLNLKFQSSDDDTNFLYSNQRAWQDEYDIPRIANDNHGG